MSKADKLGMVIVIPVPADQADVLFDRLVGYAGDWDKPWPEVMQSARITDLDAEVEAVNRYLTGQFVADPGDVPTNECESEARYLLGRLAGKP